MGVGSRAARSGGIRAAVALLALLTTCRDRPTHPGDPHAERAIATGTHTIDPSKAPLLFERNDGQFDPAVMFAARAQGLTVFLTRDGATLSMIDDRPRSRLRERDPDPAGAESPLYPSVVRLSVPGASKTAPLEPEAEQRARSNYLIGSDPSKWHTGVPNFGRVVAREIKPGIDLVYHSAAPGRLEHDFVVKPGANADDLVMEIDGADDITLGEAGALEIHVGDRVITQLPPVVYQDIDGEHRALPGRYRLVGERQVGFLVAAYDRARDLVIDPVTIIGGTGNISYPGGEGAAIAVDSSGSAYVTGNTYSRAFPVTSGAYQSVHADGLYPDVFVTKMASDGASLVYSTLIGDIHEDCGTAIAVDASGYAYVGGWTVSAFPTTTGAFQTRSGGNYESFVAKLSTDGSSLVYSTFLGAVGHDYVYGIAVDTAGAAYVTGSTTATAFPVTAEAYTTTAPVGTNAFVTKISTNGAALVYSTYLGGAGTDVAYAVAVDSSGAAYVTGYTSSTDFPSPAGYVTTAPTGNNAFVAKIATNGAALVYSTYLGGTGADYGYGIAVDSSGAAYVGGQASAGFPTVAGFDTSHSSTYDGFVTKLATDGTALTYSTFVGGAGSSESVTAVAIDSTGAAYATGNSNSTSAFPVSSGAYLTSYVGAIDAFLVKIASGGASLAYGTYLGGAAGADYGQGIAVDANGAAYVTGYTQSSNFPTTASAYATRLRGGQNAFVTKVATNGTLAYSSFLGANAGTSYGGAIAADAAGNAYLTGWTFDADFPATVGAYSTTNLSSVNHCSAFVAKFDSTQAPVYATYLGGTSIDYGYCIAVDSTGAAYIAGSTASTNMPISTGAYRTKNAGGYDAFAAKLSTNGAALLYGTYIGGALNEDGLGIAVDSTGAAWIAGQTRSTDFPATAGAYLTTLASIYGSFATKVSTNGAALLYSSLLSSTANATEGAYGVAVDSAGAAYVTGSTLSSTFPVTGGAYQGSNAGGRDIFVTKLTSDGSAFVYSTYIGGATHDYATGIAVDSAGAAYITGHSPSGFPVTAGAYQTHFMGGSEDVTVTKLSTNGTSLVYATYLGGTGVDYGQGIAVDSSGVAYVAGYTDSTDFPGVSSGYQTSNLGGDDALAAIVSADGSALFGSTYIGGELGDFATGIALAGRFSYVAGYTGSRQIVVDNIATFHGLNDAFMARLTGASLTGIEMISFTASRQTRGVELAWTAGVWPARLGFRLHRAIASTGGDRERLPVDMIYALPGQSSFSSVDATSGWDGTVVYWLEDVMTDGSSTFFGPVTPSSDRASGTTSPSLARSSGASPGPVREAAGNGCSYRGSGERASGAWWAIALASALALRSRMGRVRLRSRAVVGERDRARRA